MATSSISFALSRGKQSNLPFGNALAASLVSDGRHTVKWIGPIERFVDAIVLLWLFDIIFKSVTRSSQRLTKA
jgi:hypothetical protein